MSRIGKQQRVLPKGVEAVLEGGKLKIKGPKGELTQETHPEVTIVIENGLIRVQIINEKKVKQRALWGTYSSLIKNMIQGVTVGFKKQLEINGVGYKVSIKGENLILEVGFSHLVEVKPLAGIKFSVEKNVINIEGADKQVVGEMAAQIRRIRKPEPYKGKGIKYIDEIIRRKAGKTASKGE